MSIRYDLYATPTPNKEAGATHNETPSYHARIVERDTLHPDTLIQHICERSSLGKGDVVSLFAEIGREVSQQLLAGKRVNIPGLGTFSLTLQVAKGATPKSTRAQHVKVKQINFRAEAELRNQVINNAIFERSQENRHSASISNEEIKEAVTNYLKKQPFITRKTFCQLCQLTKCTAINHLHRLVNEGVLVNSNTPHNPIYMLATEATKE